MTDEQAYILVAIPHMSQHTISLSPVEVIASFGGATAVFFYLVFALIGAGVFIGLGLLSDRP